MGRGVTKTWRLLSQLKTALKIKLEDDESGIEERDDAMKQRLSTMNGEQFLILLDNVWGDSIAAVQEIIEALPDNISVVLSTREAAVVEELFFFPIFSNNKCTNCGLAPDLAAVYKGDSSSESRIITSTASCCSNISTHSYSSSFCMFTDVIVNAPKFSKVPLVT